MKSLFKLLILFSFVFIAVVIAGSTETIIPSLNYPATVYDDVYISLTSVRVTANAPDFNVFNNGNYALEFQDNARQSRDEVFFTFQMPHSYKINGTFNAHLHYSYDTNNTGVGTFSLSCSKADINGYFTGHNFNLNTTSSNVGEDKHFLTSFPSFNLYCTQVSCIMQCTLRRESDQSSDSYNSGIYVHAIDFHVPMDKFGTTWGLI